MSVNRILRGENFPVGFRFRPTDEELISHYLIKKINGKKEEVEIIPEVDMCHYEPCELPGKSLIKSKDQEWFFFSPCQKKYPNGRRANRATMKGYWKTTGKDREIKRRKNLIGMKKTLVFLNGKAPKGKRTPWIMHEYSAIQNDIVGSRLGQRAFVICRLFYKPYEIVASPKNKRIDKENENLAYDDEFDPSGQSPTQSSPMATESGQDVNILGWLNDSTPERTPDTPINRLNKLNIISDGENSKADVTTTQVGGQLLDQLQTDHQLELLESGGCPELGSGHSFEDSSGNDQWRVTQTLDTHSPVDITELLNEIIEDDPDEHQYDQATNQTNPTTSTLLSVQSIPQSARTDSWSTQPGIPQSSSARMDYWSTPDDIPQSAHMDCWSFKYSRSNTGYLGKAFNGDGQLYDQSELNMSSNRPHSLLSDPIVGGQFMSATWPDYLFNNLCEGSDDKISLFDNANAENTGVASQSSQQQQLDNWNVENSSTGIVIQSRQQQLSNQGPLKQGLAPRRIRLQTRINITAAPVVDASNEGSNATTDMQDNSMASNGAFCNYSGQMMKSEEENSDTDGSDRAETVRAEEVPNESNSGISKRLSPLMPSKDDNKYSGPTKMVTRRRAMAKAVGIQSCYHVWAGLLLVMLILGFGLWSYMNS